VPRITSKTQAKDISEDSEATSKVILSGSVERVNKFIAVFAKWIANKVNHNAKRHAMMQPVR
jgi:hypothetical protein